MALKIKKNDRVRVKIPPDSDLHEMLNNQVGFVMRIGALDDYVFVKLDNEKLGGGMFPPDCIEPE